MADKYVSSNQFFIGVQRIINLMNGKIGDVALNTTDQTINGAINENVSSIKELKNKIDKIQTGGGSSPSVDLSDYPKRTELSTVATSGNYNDLNNKPTIPSISGLASEEFVTTKINEAKLDGVKVDLTPYAKTADLSTVAKSGDYNDLNNKPTIPSISGLASEAFVKNAINEAKLNGSGSNIDLSIYAKTADLSTVAKSGSYIDLTDKPYIPSDPDLTPYAKTAELSNVAKTGSYNDLKDKPNIPNIPTLSTVATSGNYNDLTNKPTILTEDQVISIVNSQLSTVLNDALNAEY
nr:MAG TPA: hypothetical protein [Caudoviricetes sp.]